eukprot:Gregarina_sp_Poly_1__685@NODE_1163_length_4887_cov_131_620332_g798_i0_p4_GENE_NODE_1163_length_4887_cov_131_620332_g798_i0NODE_1163_length_4887_cov_131_620332_g798_i0_p4_ORF_typecomplete_len160_score10_38_NODE_1163_length_4887_cov_131_620332_g798_i019182397
MCHWNRLSWISLWMCIVEFIVGGTVELSNNFVWLSDIHLDLLYESELSQDTYCRDESKSSQILNELRQTIACPWINWEDYSYPDSHRVDDEKPGVSIISSSNPFIPAHHGRYGCDSPASLTWAVLTSIRTLIETSPVDFILITGDLAGHYWTSRSAKFR